MRFMDIIFRGGHLSDAALARAFVLETRPAHLEQCELCTQRAARLSDWLIQIRDLGIGSSDAAFPPAHLTAQRARILGRLERLDSASRVISFPKARPLRPRRHVRRVAPGWLGVTAAAGIALGFLAGHLVTLPSRGAFRGPSSADPPPLAKQSLIDDEPGYDTTADFRRPSDMDDPTSFDEVDRPSVRSVEALAALTPRQFRIQPASVGPLKYRRER